MLKQKLIAWWRKFSGLKIFRSLKFGFWILIGVGALFFISKLNLFYLGKVTVLPFAEEKFKYIEEKPVQKELAGFMGKRIWSVSLKDVKDAVIKKFPFISDVYVTKRAPDTLIVRITEREPALALGIQQDATNVDVIFLIDKDGMVLGNCSDYLEICSVLPYYYISATKVELEVGKTVYLPYKSQLLELNNKLKEQGFAIQKFMNPVSEVIVACQQNGANLIFSTTKPILSQIDELILTTQKLKKQGKKYKEIDLRYDRPVVRVDKYTTWVTE